MPGCVWGGWLVGGDCDSKEREISEEEKYRDFNNAIMYTHTKYTATVQTHLPNSLHIMWFVYYEMRELRGKFGCRDV